LGPHSLSGVCLDGDKLVHLVYVDEAGIGDKRQEPYLVVAGVFVDGDKKLNGVKNALERIMLRHIPKRLQEGFVFHADEVFNGGKIIKRNKKDFIGPREWPIERRLAIAEEIMEVLRKFKLPIAIGFTEREAFQSSMAWPEGFPESETTIAAHVATYMNCAIMAEQWMRKETRDENCIFVVENNDDAKQMISEVHRYHQDKKIDSLLDDESKLYFPLRKIQEDPLIQPKKQSNPLILADFCAYVFKKFLMKNPHYNRFVDQMRGLLISFEEEWLDEQRRKISNRAQRAKPISSS
jgi:Protein of unknown function (DUF3800)